MRCLLELRADGNRARLPRFALVYGLAVANNWAMVAFGPIFLLGAVWAAKANPFNVKFLNRVLKEFNAPRLPLSVRVRQGLGAFNPRLWAAMLGCFLAGLSLFLLLPLAAIWPDNAQMDFWPALLSTLRMYKKLLLAFPMTGDSSAGPACVVAGALYDHPLACSWGKRRKLPPACSTLFTALFLAVCLWIGLDLPLSPRRLGLSVPCLPLYYLCALSAGYFSGYFLLVFGIRPARCPAQARPALERLVESWPDRCGRGGAGGRCRCFCSGKNLPHILWSRSGALGNYAAQLERSLPPPGAVLLSDGSFRLLCLENTLIRRGQQAAYLPIDTFQLAHEPGYFQFVQEQHPEFHLTPPVFCTASDLTNLAVLTAWVRELASVRDVYYLHPVFGYLGEPFSAQPRGLFYQLKLCAANALDAGPLPPEVLAENRAFWRAFAAGPLTELLRRIPPPEQPDRPGRWKRLLEALDIQPESDHWASWWGAIIPGRSMPGASNCKEPARWPRRADCFTLALQLNPDNTAAQINREFNQSLSAHKPATIQSGQQVDAWLGKRRSWEQICYLDGPVDEPNVCYKLGTIFAETGLPRQAIREFARAQILAPDYADAGLRLAEQLLRVADYTNALAEVNQALQLAPQSSDGLLVKSHSLLLLRDYEHAIALLNNLLNGQTNPPARLARAFAYLQLGNLDAARQDYRAGRPVPYQRPPRLFRTGRSGLSAKKHRRRHQIQRAFSQQCPAQPCQRPVHQSAFGCIARGKR